MGNRITDTIELKKAMIEKGLDKIVSLSSASSINRNTLGDILSGISQPSANVMNKLVVTLDIPPERAGQIFFSENLPDT